MWSFIIIIAVIAIIALLFMGSKDNGNQAFGAYIIGNLLPALVKIGIVIGVIVLIFKACS